MLDAVLNLISGWGDGVKIFLYFYVAGKRIKRSYPFRHYLGNGALEVFFMGAFR